MSTFWERAAHSVYRMFSLFLLLIVSLVISHFGFEGGTFVLIASLPGHCLYFTCNMSVPFSTSFVLFLIQCSI